MSLKSQNSREIIWKEDSIDITSTNSKPNKLKADDKVKIVSNDNINNPRSNIQTIPKNQQTPNRNITHIILSDADYSDNDFHNNSDKEKEVDRQDSDDNLYHNIKHMRDKYTSIMTDKKKTFIESTQDIDVMEYNIIGKSFIGKSIIGPSFIEEVAFTEDVSKLKMYGKVSLYFTTIWMSFAIGYAWVSQIRSRNQMESYFG